jgi:hypothetical protein
MREFLKKSCLLALLALVGIVNAQTNTVPRVVTPPPPRSTPPPAPRVPSHTSGSSSTTRPVNRTSNSGIPRSNLPAGQGGDHRTQRQAGGGTAGASARTSTMYGIHHDTVDSHTTYPSSSGHNLPTPAALSEPESRSTLEHLNQLRAHLSGTGSRPLPPGRLSAGPTGRTRLTTDDGSQFEIRKDGTVASYLSKDRSATFFRNGRMRSLHTPTIDVRTGAHGERTVILRRSDQSIFVRTGRHDGYLERPIILSGGRQIIQRTYVVNGVVFTRVYEPYDYRGVLLLNYVPDAYYPPGMYGWVYYPWRPVAIAFVPPNAQWSVANRNYFAPSPVYNSGYSWLADFDISDVLQKCFDRQSNDDPALPQEASTERQESENRVAALADTPVSPELKDAIAGEIRDQLANANATASGAAPSPSHTQVTASLQLDHVFVVSTSLEVNAGQDESCSLSGGDVLQLAAPPESDGTTAQARVASSHRADCPTGEIVEVSVSDLQEMQNDLRAEMDAGLRTLRENQGRDGWPKAPASALAAQPRPSLNEMPAADPTASQLVEGEQRELAEAEASISANAFTSSSN